MVSADQMFQINHQAVVRDYYVEPRIGTSISTRVLYLCLCVGENRKGRGWQLRAPSLHCAPMDRSATRGGRKSD